MKVLLPLFLVLVCVLLGGCVSPDFSPYVGEQDWPQSPGSTVETNYVVPIYYGWPDKPYTVLGVITVKGSHPATVASYAKSKGADALIYRGSLTGNAGTYTTPGHATSITSGNYAYGQYSGLTTTTYSPGISVPLIVTVTAYNAIKWDELARFVPPPLSSDGQTNVSEELDPEILKTAEAGAEKGDLTSQAALAGIYDFGISVQIDSAKAAYWHLRAAKQGDAASQLRVGEMYEKGEGVMQDYVEAYKWFNIAAVASESDEWNTTTNFLRSKEIIETLKKSWVPVAERAKAARDQLAQQMTSEQIAEGQRRSAAFVPRKETPSSN